MNIAAFHYICTITASTHRTTDYIPQIRTSSARYPTMHSTMRDSSDSERSCLYQFSPSSPPPLCPQVHSVPVFELPTPLKSSPIDSAIKREAQELYKRLQDLHSPEWIGEEGNQKFFPVTPAVWLALQDVLFLNNDKFSCHYDAKKECLEVKMVSPIHEVVKSDFMTTIQRKLFTLEEKAPAKSAVRAVISSIKYKGELPGKASGEDKRRPDAAFVSGQRRKPSLVVEIGHSQNGATKFDPIADKYIGGSQGRIRTMIGLDMEYRTPESRERLRTQKRWATYQIYRSRINKKGRLYPHTTKDPVVFQNVHGVVNPRAKLRLELADFLQPNTGNFLGYSIEISHRELCNVIAEGDETQDVYDGPDFEDDEPLEYSPIHKGSPSIDSEDRSDTSVGKKRKRGGEKRKRGGRKRKRASAGEEEMEAVPEADGEDNRGENGEENGEANVEWAFTVAHARAASPRVVI